MKKKHLDIVFLLLSFCSYSAYSQINCTVPLPPVLSSVSVQPETGKTEFTWIPSESTDIAAYIIYSYKGGDGFPIDTVWDPAATSHTYQIRHPNIQACLTSLQLTDCLPFQGCPGAQAHYQMSSALFSVKQMPTHAIRRSYVEWNSYLSVYKAVTGYSLMLSIDGADYSEEAATGPDATNFTIEDFITDANYCFYVRANLEDGSFSTSNKACVLTRMQRPPAWINADYATVIPGAGIGLSFTIDPASEINHFLLEKKTAESGTFDPLSMLEPHNGTVTYTDHESKTNAINYYRLSAINNCNIPVTISNISLKYCTFTGNQWEST